MSDQKSAYLQALVDKKRQERQQEKAEKASRNKGRMRAALQGITMSGHDEIYGHMKAIGHKLTGGEGSYMDAYSKAQQAEDKVYRDYAKAHPMEAMAIETATGMVLPGGVALKAATKGAKAAKALAGFRRTGDLARGIPGDVLRNPGTAASMLRRRAVEGAADGAVSGWLGGDSTQEGGRMRSAQTGALFGGGVGAGVGAGQRALASTLGQRINKNPMKNGKQTPIWMMETAGDSRLADSYRIVPAHSAGAQTVANKMEKPLLKKAAKKAKKAEKTARDRVLQDMRGHKDTLVGQNASFKEQESILAAEQRAAQVRAQAQRYDQRQQSMDDGVANKQQFTQQGRVLADEETSTLQNLTADSRRRQLDDQRAASDQRALDEQDFQAQRVADNTQLNDQQVLAGLPPRATPDERDALIALSGKRGPQKMLLDGIAKEKAYQGIKEESFDLDGDMFGAFARDAGDEGLTRARAQGVQQADDILSTYLDEDAIDALKNGAILRDMPGDRVLTISNDLATKARAVAAAGDTRQGKVLGDASRSIRNNIKDQLEKRGNKALVAEFDADNLAYGARKAWDDSVRALEVKPSTQAVTPSAILNNQQKDAAFFGRNKANQQSLIDADLRQAKEDQAFSESQRIADLNRKEASGLADLRDAEKVATTRADFTNRKRTLEDAKASAKNLLKKTKRNIARQSEILRNQNQETYKKGLSDVRTAKAAAKDQFTQASRAVEDRWLGDKSKFGKLKERHRELQSRTASTAEDYQDAVRKFGRAGANMAGDGWVTRGRGLVQAAAGATPKLAELRTTPGYQRFYAGYTAPQKGAQKLYGALEKAGVTGLSDRAYMALLRAALREQETEKR